MMMTMITMTMTAMIGITITLLGLEDFVVLPFPLDIMTPSSAIPSTMALQ